MAYEFFVIQQKGKDGNLAKALSRLFLEEEDAIEHLEGLSNSHYWEVARLIALTPKEWKGEKKRE